MGALARSNEAPRRHERTSRVVVTRGLWTDPGLPGSDGGGRGRLLGVCPRAVPSHCAVGATMKAHKKTLGVHIVTRELMAVPRASPWQSTSPIMSLICASVKCTPATADPVEIVRVKYPIGIKQFKGLVDAIDVERRLQGLLEHVTELVIFHFPWTGSMRVQRSRHSASVGAMPSALNLIYTFFAEAALLLRN